MDRPIRILVVDDDAPTRRLLSAALSAEGLYEVVTAKDGEEALTLFVTCPEYHLIVSDLNMPGINGIELIEKIRLLECRIPILVLSSIQTQQTVAQALEIGADDYLQKPVDLRELRRAVAYLVDPSRERSASVTSPVVRNDGEGSFVEFTLSTDTQQAERFQRFAERLLVASLAEKERKDLHLALEEIVRNAMEWGNQNDPNKILRLSYCVLPDRVTFRIEDEGPGWDPSKLKDPSLDPQAHIKERRASGKRMGGWGVFLARKMMDEVTYNQKGNVVFLTKYLRNGYTPSLSGDSTHVTPTVPRRRATAMLRKTTRLLRKEDPRFKEA